MEPLLNSTRRHFLKNATLSLGALAMSSFVRGQKLTKTQFGEPHFTPRAKRVIYLFQAGGPSQLEMLDYKPALRRLHGQELPASVSKGQRVTEFTAGSPKPMVIKIPGTIL